MRTRVWASSILLPLFCLSGAAVAAAPDPGAAKAVVDGIWQHYVEATRLHSAGEFGKLFTEDAVIEDCTSVTRGRAQIQSLLRRLYANSESVVFGSRSDGFETASALIVQRGIWFEEYLDHEGKKRSTGGRLLLVVRQETDSHWRVHRVVSLPSLDDRPKVSHPNARDSAFPTRP